ncbi:MAG: replication-associated recombination protein A [Candidatus Absconditabacterales bacterium]
MIEPIASFLRPETLDEFVGQVHLVGESKPLRVFLQSGKVPSMIFRGPPGCGKTTIAHIISKTLNAEFFRLSGVTSKKEDLKKLIEQAKLNHQYGKQTIIFLDEIHRRNKAQQDTLLPFVEKGTIILIGATTENPSFTINNALLSRCRVFVFEKLSDQEIFDFIKTNLPKILDRCPGIIISDENTLLIAKLGNGDLRNALNLLESVILLKEKGEISDQDILAAGQKQVYYDRDGEEHYNIISALHKSLRDSDADAACYRIQRMLMGGEDPLYIARRLIRFASEDIGPADNNALLLANVTYDAIAKIGMPECDVMIFQLAMYLAKAKKNNVAYRTALETRADVEKYGNLPVPMHLRNASTKLMKDIGYGKEYKYVHNDSSAKDQEHFPKELKGRKYV